MRRVQVFLLVWLVTGSPAGAGTLISTIGGQSHVASVPIGVPITVDAFLTIDPGDTPIGPIGSLGAAYALDFFSAPGLLLTSVIRTAPPGWVPLPSVCLTTDLVCENVLRAAILFDPSTAPLPVGVPIYLGSQIIDAHLALPGQSLSVGFTIAALLASDHPEVDVRDEYTSVAASFTLVPEPGTASLLASGLLALARARRAQKSTISS